MKRTVTILILGFLLMVGLGRANAGEVYKWVDKNGTMIFSEFPPPDGTSTDKIILDAETRHQADGSRRPTSFESMPRPIEKQEEAIEQGVVKPEPRIVHLPNPVEPERKDYRAPGEKYITDREAFERARDPGAMREALKKDMEKTAREVLEKERSRPRGSINGQPGSLSNPFEPSPGHVSPRRF